MQEKFSGRLWEECDQIREKMLQKNATEVTEKVAKKVFKVMITREVIPKDTRKVTTVIQIAGIVTVMEVASVTLVSYPEIQRVT